MLFFGNFSNTTNDTILLPLQNGVLSKEMQSVDFDISFNIAIYPVNNYEVKSCSKGKVKSIFCQEDGRQVVMIKNVELVYGYVLDSPLVKVGQSLEKAQIIGSLKNVDRDTVNHFPLIFLVLKNGNFIDPRKFIVYKYSEAGSEYCCVHKGFLNAAGNKRQKITIDNPANKKQQQLIQAEWYINILSHILRHGAAFPSVYRAGRREDRPKQSDTMLYDFFEKIS
jgi:hypothetical protein